MHMKRASGRGLQHCLGRTLYTDGACLAEDFDTCLREDFTHTVVVQPYKRTSTCCLEEDFDTGCYSSVDSLKNLAGTGMKVTLCLVISSLTLVLKTPPRCNLDRASAVGTSESPGTCFTTSSML